MALRDVHDINVLLGVPAFAVLPLRESRVGRSA
jgi:hypothetical protein